MWKLTFVHNLSQTRAVNYFHIDTQQLFVISCHGCFFVCFVLNFCELTSLQRLYIIFIFDFFLTKFIFIGRWTKTTLFGYWVAPVIMQRQLFPLSLVIQNEWVTSCLPSNFFLQRCSMYTFVFLAPGVTIMAITAYYNFSFIVTMME